MTGRPKPVTIRELRELREVTQVEIAKAMRMAQPNVSALERQQDMAVSTLRRYVEALGGRLEVLAIVGRERIRLDF